MTTLTLALNERVTRVYDTAFLVDSSRPFARWELADHLQLDGQYKERITPGTEETVAEMTDARGVLLGRWVVRWDENGKGTCREVGKINRYVLYFYMVERSRLRVALAVTSMSTRSCYLVKFDDGPSNKIIPP
jgi:hypothetical protein